MIKQTIMKNLLRKLCIKFLNRELAYKQRKLSTLIKEGREAVKEYNLKMLCAEDDLYYSDALIYFENHIGGRLDDEFQLKLAYHNFYNSFTHFKNYETVKYYNIFAASLHKQDFERELKRCLKIYDLEIEDLRFEPKEFYD